MHVAAVKSRSAVATRGRDIEVVSVGVFLKQSRDYVHLARPPHSAAYEPGEATTCALSVAYGLGATRRPSGACSASTLLIFPCFHQIVKLAAHA